MSVGFLDHRKLARALAADLRLGLIAADRQQRIAEHGPPDGAGSNPIEVLRAACEQIKRDSGARAPSCMLMPAWLSGRIRDILQAKVEHAERMLGIDREAEGKFPNGWPWSKRRGRPSKEERRLIQGLPGWRSLLAGLTRPVRTAEERLQDLLAADPARWRIPNSIAMHEQTYREYERTRAAWRTVRRPTGKRAQRRAGKEWTR